MNHFSLLFLWLSRKHKLSSYTLFAMLFLSQILNGQSIVNEQYGIKNDKQLNRVSDKWGSANYHATLFLENDSILHGQLFFVNEYGVYLWKDTISIPLLSQHEDLLEFIERDKITKIMIRDYFRNMNGIKKGLLWGGIGGLGFGVYSSYILYTVSPLIVIPLSIVAVSYPMILYMEKNKPNNSFFEIYNRDQGGIKQGILKDYTLFSNTLPPGIEDNGKSLDISPEGSSINSYTLMEHSPLAKRLFHQPRLSLFPFLVFGSANNMVGHTGLGVSFNITDRHYIQYFQNDMDLHVWEKTSLMTRTEWAHYMTRSINYGYKFINRGPLQSRRYEVAVQGGISYNNVNEIASKIFLSNISGRTLLTQEIIIEGIKLGWNLHLSADYYLTKNVSLRLLSGWNTFAPLEIRENKALHPVTEEWMGTDNHLLDLSTWDHRIGIRVHFF